MKLPILLGALILCSTPVLAAPKRLLCTESGGVLILEANEVMEYFDSKKAELLICTQDDVVEDECHFEPLADEEYPITIEFNSDTAEAVVGRFSDIKFYSVDETRDQYRLIVERRPIDESTYQSTGHQSFEAYSIVIDKDSLSTVYTKINDRTDGGSADEGGILYTTIVNGSCKESSF